MSAIRKFSAEAILLAGGGAALLLQLANPAVGRGVAEHSDFANRPLDRLRGTLTYLTVTVYGTPEEARLVARRVGEAHAPVRSADYDARDPELQLWVAATLYDTAVRVHELAFGALDPEAAETLLADYAVIGTALGVPRSLWPADRAAFAAYWGAAVGRLRVDEPARRVAQQLLHPVSGPWWLRSLMPTARVVTAGLLDEPLREAYGLHHDPRRFARFVRFARGAYPHLPRRLREAPMRWVLRRFRRLSRATPPA
ncbi:oxygenase MpaB family protein [Leifsonia sp. H3M29-4]|uniref:oxygenase MpaB family protein n=1 Tax=Salinibacterium metalliresistens TaxID=3031321 RepID=UPI0023DB8DB7|nr:oxygenase MpaB family protein [Salinibacterium metalliresistens]MDF1478329.1 oxygenase MpaB family protein [Salinibacterium metalliresistens]